MGKTIQINSYQVNRYQVSLGNQLQAKFESRKITSKGTKFFSEIETNSEKQTEILAEFHYDPGPHYAEEFKNAALFLQLGLPSMHCSVTKTELIENDLQTGVIWKRRLYVLVWTENKNILKTELYEDDSQHQDNYVTSLTEFSPNTNPK